MKHYRSLKDSLLAKILVLAQENNIKPLRYSDFQKKILGKTVAEIKGIRAQYVTFREEELEQLYRKKLYLALPKLL